MFVYVDIYCLCHADSSVFASSSPVRVLLKEKCTLEHMNHVYIERFLMGLELLVLSLLLDAASPLYL